MRSNRHLSSLLPEKAGKDIKLILGNAVSVLIADNRTVTKASLTGQLNIMLSRETCIQRRAETMSALLYVKVICLR